MRINKNMRKLYDEMTNNLPTEFPDGLTNLLSEGFIADEGCVFLFSLYRLKGNARRDLFPDEVGYECFVNHIHIDDFSKDNILATAIVFVEKLELEWKAQSIRDTLRIVLSFEDDNCVVRFNLVRDKQDWLREDLECYEHEALLVVDVPSLMINVVGPA